MCEASEISGRFDRNESETAVRSFLLQRLEVIPSSSSVPEIDFDLCQSKSRF